MSWQVTGASVIGSSHLLTSKPCQDSHGYQSLPGDVLLIAVADGLGTAEKSEIGSRLAVDTALASMSFSLSASELSPDALKQVLTDAFQTARTALEERAAAENLSLRDLGSTLICVILGVGWAACGQIGDGAVVVMQKDDVLATLSSPQRGEYANETVPLTMAKALEMVRYSHHEVDVQALAVFSDGLQNLALENEGYQPFEPFFKPFFKLIRDADVEEARIKLEAFLGSERLCNRTDDDKTLVLAAWQGILDDEGYSEE